MDNPHKTFEAAVAGLVTLFKKLRQQPPTRPADPVFQDRIAYLCLVGVNLAREMKHEGLSYVEAIALMRPALGEARLAAEAHSVQLTLAFTAIETRFV